MSAAVTTVLELRSVRGTGGGPEKTILFGAEQHDRRRFAIIVCYIRDERDDVFGIDERARQRGVDYVEIRERHSFDLRIWRPLVDLVTQRRVDVIHGHDYKTNLLAYLLARRTGAVPLATAHGWTGHSSRERRLYYPAERKLLAWFPHVIAVSTDIKQQLVRAGARPDRVTVLLNGIDPSAFRRDAAAGAALRRSLGIAPDDRLIGSVGRLEPQKRFDLLMDAFTEVRRARPRARLAIVGDGSLRDALQTRAEALALGPSCLLLGHRHDIVALHSAFDLFVQSSDYEGTPNAVLEAMAMGTPLVATDAGGTRELAFDATHGLIVPPNDRDALVRAILQVLDEPAAAAARAAAARARVEGDLSFAARTRTLEAVYDRLVPAKPPAEVARA